jgi:hypothetical protein
MRNIEFQKVIPKSKLISDRSEVPAYLADLGIDIVDPKGLMNYRDRNLLSVEAAPCAISTPINPAIPCLTTPH